MPQQTLGELFTSVVGGLPGAEDLNAKASAANPVFTGSISLDRKANSTVGNRSIAIGYESEATHDHAVAIGHTAKAKSPSALAFGTSAKATGTSAIAIVQSSNATATRSIAIGNSTSSDGIDCIAMGTYNATMQSIPEWTANTSYKINDYVKYAGSKYKCKIANSDSEFISTNWEQTYTDKMQAFVLGNGTNTARSNALTLDWTGDLHLARDIYINANADGTGGTKLDTSTLASKASPEFTGSISLGRKANTTVGTNSFAVGGNVEASGEYSHAEGLLSIASGSRCHAEGGSTKAVGNYSHAEGLNTNASGMYSHAESSTTTASGSASHAEGYNTTASGTYAHAEGDNTTASSLASHAEGRSTTASGYYSHAEGSGTNANGMSSHASGTYNVLMNSLPWWNANTEYAIGDIVLDRNTSFAYRCKEANSDASFNSTKWTWIPQDTIQAFVVGNGTADNARSNALTLDWTGDLHLLGDIYTGANANGTGGTKLDTSTLAPKASPVFTGSISLGRKASTTVGSNSFAVGNDVEASADNAHAEGNATRAAYVDSHAEGWGSEAISQAAHAEGRQGRATAFAAHAEGCQTAANGYASHAQGMGTQAKNKSQHVAGEYNVADPSTDGAGFRGTYAEIIGNGADTNNRSNARALDWSGNEYIAGDLYVGCSADSTSGTKLARIPAAPSTDGTYTLQCVVSSGAPTYSWVSTGA